MIERHLRNGVMTEVYRARREGSGRDRFEVRRFTLVASSEALRAVRRELDRIQALRMPAIPALVDVIDDPVGLLVVTETVAEGATSLRMTLDAAGPLEVADCTRIVRVVAGVLDVLHGATPQVLHRRLSPDTITLIGPQREVRVEECGLAQALVDAGLVNARVPLQARQYLSPDELLQRPSPRGDLFALASVAFECLTGRPAFLGATEASLSAAILRGVRPSVNALRPEVPAAVDVVLARAWSADASKGFASAAALADALSTALGIPGSGARPPLRVEPPHGSPPAGAPVLSPGELSIMKATILGVGTPSKPPAAPRAKPNEAEKHALQEPAPMAPTRSRLVGGRPQMPTQKVEVPRIHPPGTERVGEEGERPTFPPARLPPAPPIPFGCALRSPGELRPLQHRRHRGPRHPAVPREVPLRRPSGAALSLDAAADSEGALALADDPALQRPPAGGGAAAGAGAGVALDRGHLRDGRGDPRVGGRRPRRGHLGVALADRSFEAPVDAGAPSGHGHRSPCVPGGSRVLRRVGARARAVAGLLAPGGGRARARARRGALDPVLPDPSRADARAGVVVSSDVRASRAASAVRARRAAASAAVGAAPCSWSDRSALGAGQLSRCGRRRGRSSASVQPGEVEDHGRLARGGRGDRHRRPDLPREAPPDLRGSAAGARGRAAYAGATGSGRRAPDGGGCLRGGCGRRGRSGDRGRRDRSGDDRGRRDRSGDGCGDRRRRGGPSRAGRRRLGARAHRRGRLGRGGLWRQQRSSPRAPSSARHG
ncbi:MAG: protein kinase [Deltaproteobacteria bacterium]|nr:protein kinase [Deltaproteobacteria bacterium]